MWKHSSPKDLRTHLVPAYRRQRSKTPQLRVERLEDRRILAFNAPTEYSTGVDGAFDVATADFNNDGQLDLVSANYYNSTVSVLLGDGQGGFGSPTALNVGNYPRSVAVGDFNEDGNMDLATANQGDYTPNAPPSVSVLLGIGDGTFSPLSTVPTDGNAHSIAVGDFNADGSLDLGVGSADYWSGYYTWASVHTGDGAGNFSTPKVNIWFNGVFESAATADLNGDGADDLVLGDNRYGGVYVLLGDPSGFLQSSALLTTGSVVEDVALGDLNRDGFVDIVTANSWNLDGVSVMLNNGQGGFGAAQRYGAGLISETVVLGDFSGDGNTDIAFGGSNIVRGYGNGTFSVAELNPPGGYAAAAADTNGDGWLDLISRSYNTVSVSFNDQTWGPVTPSVFISVSDASITEGKRGVKYLTFTVSLSDAANASVTVQYATQNGSAAASSDYQAQNGTLTFEVGETEKTVSIAVFGDNVAELDESFQLLLSNATGNATIADAVGLGTIVNDDIARSRRNGRRTW